MSVGTEKIEELQLETSKNKKRHKNKRKIQRYKKNRKKGYFYHNSRRPVLHNYNTYLGPYKIMSHNLVDSGFRTIKSEAYLRLLAVICVSAVYQTATANTSSDEPGLWLDNQVYDNYRLRCCSRRTLKRKSIYGENQDSHHVTSDENTYPVTLSASAGSVSCLQAHVTFSQDDMLKMESFTN